MTAMRAEVPLVAPCGGRRMSAPAAVLRASRHAVAGA
jgi:hypothetical protein